MISTVVRFASVKVINIAATVHTTAYHLLKRLDEINAADIALELSAQGIDILAQHSGQGTGATATALTMAQIRRALSANPTLYHQGDGYYSPNPPWLCDH